MGGVRLQPLVDALKAALLERDVLHPDETPAAMLKPGNGKTHRAYLEPDERLRIRQLKGRPIAETLQQWLIARRQKVPDGAATAKAIDYGHQAMAGARTLPR